MILSMHQPNLLPWVGYFHKMAQSDVFVLLDAVQVPRGRSYATRTKIKTAQGQRWLTMPVKRRGLVPYNEQPLMPPDQWLTSFWETLRHNYVRAPYWNYCNFERWLNSAATNCITLAEFNIELIKWALESLKMDKFMPLQSAWSTHPETTLAPVYYCKRFECDTYLSGNGAKDYNSLVIFETFDVELRYQEFQCPVYSQLWQKFQPNLSILDLIFNLGPTAAEIVHS